VLIAITSILFMLVFDDLASISFQGLPHICSNFENRIGIVTVSLFSSSAIECGFKSMSGQNRLCNWYLLFS
jgi:hypothetical protein